MRKIVLGLSDGVDSCVAAHLLKNDGYEVIGVYLKTAGETETENARINASEAGIEFVALEISEALNLNVCKPFINEYILGRTPSPCPGCNRTVKLKTLIDFADSIGAENIATGHYVLKDGDNLYMGAYECDQSYMLSRIGREQVKRLLLPLGRYGKREVRAIAASLGFSCASRPDSRENCFIKDMNYSEYIRIHACGDLPGAGDVLYKGKLFDRHEGIYNYTVGQRWKNDFDGRRLYISRIDAAKNLIELCLWDDLFTCEVDIKNLTWINETAMTDCFEGNIRIRHTRWETPACHITLKTIRRI